MMKRYLALARVSSREQEREGFSLEVQEDALQRFATENGGEIVKLFRIAETATKPDERKTFKELLCYARKNASKLDGLIFFKVDRAARNLFDYVELERLEADYSLRVYYITQPTENTPAGRMMRRTLANMASFYTEQQSLDVRDGLARRVKSGLFVGKAPYGYINVRRDGRSLVEIDERNALKVKRIFELYAFHGHTLDTLIEKLASEMIAYTENVFRFVRSKLHNILRDRSYIGDIPYHGQWYPGVQEPIIDRPTFDRVQILLGDQVYQAHQLLYAGGLIECKFCGRPVTGELKTKKTKKGIRFYRYYRCARYSTKGHPRIRVREEQLESQMLGLFDRLRVTDDNVREWFAKVLRARTRDQQQVMNRKVDELNRQLNLFRNQQDRLLNLRLHEEIEQETFASKNTELRDRISQISIQLEACDRSRSERADISVKVFELSQVLQDKWLKADFRAKRQILEMLCLNFFLDDANLVPVWRKPFDMLAEGLVSKDSRADWRLLQPNELSAPLFQRAIAQSWEFTAEDFASVTSKI